MEVARKSMNWMPKQSAYKVAAQAAAKRRTMVAEFQAKNSALASSLSTTFINNLMGSVDNARQTAIDRIQAQVKEKQDALNKTMDSINMLA
ncbi:hypothetical protein [Mariluticola halotolerans]|uniref:hypothetical protein n=1 Tax=Mariluticola halotolerans TaxID=2909283 RepID=UPI0026E1C453|nr:hypothetical protein [Mariluticola halotolerans]UJQ95332.1 hypothetical protein L1P08_04930 [Mariluticola halotolerans]